MAYQQQPGSSGYSDADRYPMAQQYQPRQHPTPDHARAWHPADTSAFDGGDYAIHYRDTNTILSVNLAPGVGVKSRSGAMKEMSPTVTIEAKAKFSFKQMLKGAHLHETYYTGPGQVVLAPVLFGDIAALELDGMGMWMLGKHAFLASTLEVRRELKSQSLSKGLFGGQTFFIYHCTGRGLLWMHSFGAISRRELGPGEQHIVEHGHLVAWNCDYQLERPGHGVFSGSTTGQGNVCRFTGPGTIYIQSRNFYALESFIAEIAMSVES